MADVVKYRFVWRGRTAANWAALNEVLLEKEAGIELDTMPRKWKIGDGVTPWNSLPYQSGIDIDDTNIGDGRALIWDSAANTHKYADAVRSVTAGINVAVDSSDPQNLVVDSLLGPIQLKGRVADYASLPSSGNVSGDAYVNDTDKLVYVWDGSAWPADGDGLVITGLRESTGSGYLNSGTVVVPSNPSILLETVVNGIKYRVPAYQVLSAYSPATAFVSGERGIWLDFNDLSTMFQDTAGTVPVTTVGQAVALVFDKSGNGQHVSQGTLASRPTLQQDSNGIYYLNFSGSQWLERASTNTLYIGTSDILGLIAHKAANAGGTMYARAVRATGSGRYQVGVSSSTDPSNPNAYNSGAYQIPSSNNDALITFTPPRVKGVVSQFVDRTNGQNKVLYRPSGIATASGASLACDVGNTNLNSSYKFRVGCYPDATDSAPFSFYTGDMYGLFIRFSVPADEVVRGGVEDWMFNEYLF